MTRPARISFACVRSIRSANLPDAVTEMPSQERPQGHAIGVADTRRDLIDAFIACLQQMHRALDPQTLEIRQWRFSKHRVHATRKRSLAGCNGLCCLVEREPV